MDYLGDLTSHISQTTSAWLKNRVRERERQAETVKYYVPHHAVLCKDKVTTKLRVVFDASSHVEGCPSHNECLVTGPNLNPNLLDELIRDCTEQLSQQTLLEPFFFISLINKERDAVDTCTGVLKVLGLVRREQNKMNWHLT